MISGVVYFVVAFSWRIIKTHAALTEIPVGNLAFTMPFMPQPSTMHDSDFVGLIVILAGLMLYRFTAGPVVDDDDDESESVPSQNDEEAVDPSTGGSASRDLDHTESDLREPLLHGDI